MLLIQWNKNNALPVWSSSQNPITPVLPQEKQDTHSNSGASYQKQNKEKNKKESSVLCSFSYEKTTWFAS